MKGTPGPYEANYHRDDHCCPDYWTIDAEMDSLGRSGVVADTLNRDYGIDPDEDRANARLLAAAPELLEALREMLEGPPPREVREKARAAIAKAEGRDAS